jgi:hypothetical protein
VGPRLEVAGVPGISKGNDYSRAAEPRNQVVATSPYISIGRDQYDFRPEPGRDASDVPEDGVDVGSPCILHRGLGQIVAVELRYDGGKGEDLEFSALEGLAARGGEMGKAGGHRSADIQIEMHDRNPHWPWFSFR